MEATNPNRAPIFFLLSLYKCMRAYVNFLFFYFDFIVYNAYFTEFIYIDDIIHIYFKVKLQQMVT